MPPVIIHGLEDIRTLRTASLTEQWPLGSCAALEEISDHLSVLGAGGDGRPISQILRCEVGSAALDGLLDFPKITFFTCPSKLALG